VSTDAPTAAFEALSAGRWEEARAAYETALAAGESPAALEGLGLALRWLDDFPRCFEVQERAYVLCRVGGLSLAVEVALERGDREAAQAAADELERAAAAGGTAPLGAVSHLALARMASDAGDREAAGRHAEDAASAWARVNMPFEEAEARALLAELLAASAPEQAKLERRRAAETFRRLGCETRAERTEAAGRRAELSARELEVLQLVADGLSDDQIAEQLVLSPHTVHRHVANIRTKLRQSTRAGAAALAARDGLI
jgi:DNA-binding CsgD family transcriptional regulator